MIGGVSSGSSVMTLAPLFERQASGESKLSTSGRSGREGGVEPGLIFTAGMVIFIGHFSIQKPKRFEMRAMEYTIMTLSGNCFSPVHQLE
jgi:hypothetical protein